MTDTKQIDFSGATDADILYLAGFLGAARIATVGIDSNGEDCLWNRLYATQEQVWAEMTKRNISQNESVPVALYLEGTRMMRDRHRQEAV